MPRVPWKNNGQLVSGLFSVEAVDGTVELLCAARNGS